MKLKESIFEDAQDNMIEKIRETTCIVLLNTNIEIRRPEPKPQPKMTEARVYDPQAQSRPQEIKKQVTVKNTEKKVGRNDPCPCGSGKKYKNCCGKNV